MMCKSKTTCFTIIKMPFMIGKDAFEGSKTSCFTLRIIV